MTRLLSTSSPRPASTTRMQAIAAKAARNRRSHLHDQVQNPGVQRRGRSGPRRCWAAAGSALRCGGVVHSGEVERAGKRQHLCPRVGAKFGQQRQGGRVKAAEFGEWPSPVHNKSPDHVRGLHGIRAVIRLEPRRAAPAGRVGPVLIGEHQQGCRD